MPYSKIRDVVDTSLRFHAAVQNYLEAGHLEAEDPEQEALGTYLEARAERLHKALSNIEDRDRNGLDTWLQFTPETASDSIDLPPGLNARELTERLQDRSQSLIDSFDQLRTSTAAPSAKELLDNLFDFEKANAKALSVALLRFRQERD